MPLLTPEDISAEAAAVRQFVVANLIGKRTTYLPMSRASYTSDRIDWLYLRYRVAAFNTGRYPNNIGEPRASVVIANIEVKPEYRGQGLARKVISELLQPCDCYGVLEVELVHNPEFAAHLVQQDFSAFGDNLEAGLNVGFSYYRAVERSA